MRSARNGAATFRAVSISIAVVLASLLTAAWWGRKALLEAERVPLPEVPERVELPSLPPEPPPTPLAPPRDPLEAAWCVQGPAAVVDATQFLVQPGQDPASSMSAMRQAWLRCEALFSMGRVEEALAWSRRLVEAIGRPVPAKPLEPLVLEQHARIRMAAGESDMTKLERGLAASIEARRLLGEESPDLAWSTLAALQKARGSCEDAVASLARPLADLDAPAWRRLRQREPWRMQLLALAAMDRADCLMSMGRREEAGTAAIALASDLAVAVGETDPLAQQAADLRDSIVGGR